MGECTRRYPISPLHLLLLSLPLDVGAAVAFAHESADTCHPPDAPRGRHQPLLNPSSGMLAVAAASSYAAAIIACFSFAYEAESSDQAESCAFIGAVLSAALLALNLRSTKQPVIQKGVLSNVAILVWLGLTLGFALCVGLWGWLRSKLGVEELSGGTWVAVSGISLVCTCWIEGSKWVVLVLERRGFYLPRSAWYLKYGSEVGPTQMAPLLSSFTRTPSEVAMKETSGIQLEDAAPQEEV